MAGKAFRFVPDEEGIFKAANGEQVRGILNQRAVAAAAAVRKLGPRKGHFFNYRRSVKAVPARRVGRTYEAGVEVNTPGWHLPEYGTSEITPTAPLRRGVVLAGLNFKEGSA